MAEPKIYRLERIVDILQVTPERREQCMHELVYALDLATLVGAQPTGVFEWTDDGDVSSTIYDRQGNEVVKLEVSNG